MVGEQMRITGRQVQVGGVPCLLDLLVDEGIGWVGAGRALDCEAVITLGLSR
jgi:hypothetical protein